MIERLAIVRDKMLFFGWLKHWSGVVDAGDAGEIYCAERAVERAFHRTGVQEYLDYMETR